MTVPASSFGLQSRLFLIALVAFLPALLLALYAHREQRQLARAAADAQAVALVHQVASAQARVVTRALAQVETLADVPVVRGGTPAACSRYLARVRERQPGLIANIARIPANGRVDCSALPVRGVVDVSTDPVFERGMAARTARVSGYAFSPIARLGIVAVTAPITESPEGAVRGVVVLTLDLEWLREIFVRSDAPPGTRLTLVDQRGRVLARFPADASAPGTPAPEGLALIEALQRQPQGGVLTLPETPDRVYAVERLAHEGAGSLLVYAAVPKATVYAPARAQLQRHLLGLLLALVLMAVGSFLASRYLVLRPVRRLQSAAQRLAGGDLAARAGIGPGRDEMAGLGRSFDRMAASLEAREASLREHQEQLERINRAHAMLSGVNGLIIRADEREDLLADACQIAVERGGFPLAWIGLIEPGTRRWTVVRTAGTAPPGIRLPTVGADAGELPELAPVLAEARPLVQPAAGTAPDARWGRVVLPLQRNRAVIGCMAVCTTASHIVDDKEMPLLEEMAADISHALAHLEQAQRLSYVSATDLLTGLPNAARLREGLALALQRIERERQDLELAVMLVAVKGLRGINTVHGLHVGDQVLRSAAARLEALLPSDAMLARLRGGIFAIVLTQEPGGTTIAGAAERVLTCFSGPLSVDGHELAVGVRIGVSLWPADGREADVLMQHAETALSSAREAPERLRFFMPHLQRQAEARLALEGALHRALERDELYLRYQPVVAVGTRRLVGVEALLRWRHPQRGEISPAEFIPLAEAAGLMVPLGEWVMAAAFRQARRWQEEGAGGFKVAVNVAASQLKHAGFLEVVDRAIRSSGADPRRLSLGIELTESELMEDAPHAVELLHELKARGFSLSIDDFGTGYSSLAYLGRFPLDTLKIDIAFVRDLTDNPASASIVEAVVALAKALRLGTVAEGVETPAQFERLAQLDCQAVQGHLFGVARPPEAISCLAGRPLAFGGD